MLAEPQPRALLEAVADQLGFGAPATPDTRTCRALGIPDDLNSVRLAAGTGTTRLMLVTLSPEQHLKDSTGRIADRLARNAPHFCWLMVVLSPADRRLAVATWRQEGRSNRVAALIADCDHILPSDRDTFRELAATMTESLPDTERHTRWVEILGREAISRRFFLALQANVGRLADGADGRANVDTRREIALLHVSRLLFLAFLEARGWLDRDRRFLARTFDDCAACGGGFQRRVLEPLFFGTLNTPVSARAPRARALGALPFLNGGLFTRGAVEQRHRHLVMRDEDYGLMFDELFVRYRFTPNEETTEWQESAIDPEILGRAFDARRHRAWLRAAKMNPVCLGRNRLLTTRQLGKTGLGGGRFLADLLGLFRPKA